MERRRVKRKTNLFRDREEHRLFFVADFSVLKVFPLFFLLVDPTLIIVDGTFFLTKNEA